MAAATSTFSSYDRSATTAADNPTLSTQSRPFNRNAAPPRPGQHLDDADLLAWKRQYANIGLREQNIMSNSADDLSQLIDRIPYQFEVFGQDYNDPDDDEIHFDNGNGYDYETVIQERLKKANEEFHHDETPVELKHRQRVSFDAVVKAVDIVQDPQEHENTDSLPKPLVSPVVEEPPPSTTNTQSESNPHEYTVPLNDTQPKEGPSLLQQIKTMQFHGGIPAGERWSSTNANTTSNSSMREEDLSSSKSNSNNNTDIQDTSDMTTKPSTSSQKSMLVSINGGFELQDEDDYIAKRPTNGRQLKFNDDDNDKKTSNANTKVAFIPTPPTEAKPRQDPLKPQAPARPYPSMTRPKSSDSGKRTDYSNSTISKSWTDNKNKSNQQRPKSAVVSKSLESFIMKPSSGVDFDELNRKAAEKKRAELQEERRKEEKAKAKRKEELEKAQESFEKWVRDKDAERKRLNEEKRMEKEEEAAREEQCEKELKELREKKYKEWAERKKREVMLANDFRKMQADEEELASGGSSSSIHNGKRQEDHRAFNRWLRRKYEQSKEEKRQLRLEARRLRRRQRRSIKRFQLHQDLQLAKSFGYS